MGLYIKKQSCRHNMFVTINNLAKGLDSGYEIDIAIISWQALGYYAHKLEHCAFEQCSKKYPICFWEMCH